jgi:hypothetical protein
LGQVWDWIGIGVGWCWRCLEGGGLILVIGVNGVWGWVGLSWVGLVPPPGASLQMGFWDALIHSLCFWIGILLRSLASAA